MLSEHTGITGEQLKRFSSRELYSFADFDEELGEDLLGQLSQLKNNKGGEIYVAKATVIPVPRSDSESKTEDDSSTRTDVEDAAQGSDTRADEVELANEAAEA